MSNIDKQALLVSKAKVSVFTMGYISQFEASEIDSDDIDLRFEVDGVETGTTVSIVDECGHAAQIITALLDELEHYKSREERVTKLVMDNSTSWDALYKKLEAAEKRTAELERANAAQDDHINQQQDRIDVLEKRNAELGKYAGEMERYCIAYMEWSNKTDWVQGDKRFDVVHPLGKHRADILGEYIKHLEREKDAIEAVALALRDDMRDVREKLEDAERRIAETDQLNAELTARIEPMDRRIAELERSETQLINERDSAESALNDAYKAVMGQAPEWSNWLNFENAIDEIELACELWRNQTDDVIQFRQRIQELEAKLETADRLQDGAFRDGLKAGFSYGQTDDQSGFTQCMSAYSTTPASLLPDGLIRAVHFYEQVKRENPPVETGAWKDAIDWVLKEARLAASTLESSREHEVISQQEKA